MRFPLAVFSSLILLQATLLAEPIRQPPELQPGDKYRLAFVTSTMTTATSSDIETYNAFVQATADASPIGEWGLEWKAIGSTETVSARENTSTDPTTNESVPIFLLNGAELVPSSSVLWDIQQRVFRHFDVNEFGEAFNSPDPPLLTVWTGTTSDGFPRFLPDDVGVTGGPLGAGTHSTAGFGDTPSNGWMNATAIPNRLEAPVYGLSEVVTAVPEPLPRALLHVFLIVMLAARRSWGPRSARRAD